MTYAAAVPWWVWIAALAALVALFCWGLGSADAPAGPEPEEAPGRGIRVNPGRDPF